MDLTGKTVLVTGGAGFIGSHLVDHLLEAAAVGAVRVLDDLSNGRQENLTALGSDPRLTLEVGDVVDHVTVQRALQGVDVVFHLACLGVRHSLHAPRENHRVNAEGSLNLLLAAETARVERFVHVGSSEVFGTAQYVPIDEQHPTWPHTVYGASKLAGEAYARAAFDTGGLPTVVVRPFNTYGPRSHFEGDCGEVIPRSVVRVLAGLPSIVFGDGWQTRDFLHVRDTARALVDLAIRDEAVGRTVNVGYGQEISINELCALVAAAAGRTDLVPGHAPPRPGDVRRLWADNRLVKELIDFEPTVSLEAGLRELVDWFHNQPASPQQMLAQIDDRNWEL